jgi:hypothetical protein
VIILNDKRFNNEIFFKAFSKEDIKNSPNNSTIIFEFDENDIDLYNFCKNSNIEYGVEISSITEFIFITNLDAKYAFCNDIKFAKNLQKLADNYLTQTKVIVKSSIKNIEKIALAEIDGIFVL